MTQQKRNIKDYLDAILDKDGIKTEVTITLTNETMTKIIISLLLAGVTMVTVFHLIKNYFPNAQLAALEQEVYHISRTLNQ